VRQRWLVQVKGPTNSLQIMRPRWVHFPLENELHFYWVVLVATVLAIAAVHRMRTTGVSRRLVAVRDNEMMAAALSTSPASAKLTAFITSGVMASLAGYL